jgi:t-SNARE complex subunit (syntaxin)
MSTIHSTLLFKFKDVLLSFQKNQNDYKQAVQNKLKRQIAIVKPEAGDDEIDELVKDPERAMKLVTEQISGKVHRKLQNAVDDIQSKYQMILKLENSVEEVYQLTLNLNILIQTQGEMLNTIEKNLEEANDYVESGEKKLILAKKWHQQTRYKMACILVVVLIIGSILIIVYVK